MNGGYTLVDSSKLDFTVSTAYKVNGLYQKYKNAIDSQKLIIACNGIGSPIIGGATISNDVVTGTIGNNQFTISANDTVNNI